MGDVEALAQEVARLLAAVGPAQQGAELDERACALEADAGTIERRHRLVQQLFAFPAADDHARAAQRHPQRALGAERPRERQLLAHQRDRGVALAEG